MKNPSTRLRFSSTLLILLVMGVTSLKFSLLPGQSVAMTSLDFATELLKDLREHKALSWRMVATHDPYQGESFLRTHPNNTIQLHLDHAGTFREVRKDKIVEGRWKMDATNQQIKLLCERINGRPVKRSHALTRYLLISYDTHFLVLGKQGRHGVVEMKFKRLTPSHSQRSATGELF